MDFSKKPFLVVKLKNKNNSIFYTKKRSSVGSMSATMINPINNIKEKSKLVSEISSKINNISFMKSKDRNFSFSDHVFSLLKAIGNSDAKTKCKIENHFVKMGKEAAPYLVQALDELEGSTKGIAAMALIRIGEDSVSFLKEAATRNLILDWVADYIINEIRGTQVSLTNRSFEKVLVS